jgi:hypothetical protein
MGLFGKKQAVVTPVPIGDAMAWLGHHGQGANLREIAKSYRATSLDLPDPLGDFYVGQVALRNGRVAASIGGQDRGYVDEQQLPYIVPTFKRSGGQPVRCVVSKVDDTWRIYA